MAQKPEVAARVHVMRRQTRRRNSAEANPGPQSGPRAVAGPGRARTGARRLKFSTSWTFIIRPWADGARGIAGPSSAPGYHLRRPLGWSGHFAA